MFDPEMPVHDFALKVSVKGNIPVENSIVGMYRNVRNVGDCESKFHDTESNKITWNIATGNACGTIKIYMPIYEEKSENLNWEDWISELIPI